MSEHRKSRLISLALVAVIAVLFIAVFATRNRESRYTPIRFFAGCYSNGADRLVLGRGGEITINGRAAGSYKIVSPVGGKHGFLAEANGLSLTGGNGSPMVAAQGAGGFFWPISDDAITITFAPATAMTLRKIRPSC